MLEGFYVPNTPTLIGDLGVSHPLTESALKMAGETLRAAGPVDLWMVISPHFITEGGFGVVAQDPLRQLYDFSGFPPAFYQVSYQVQGSPVYAEALESLGKRRGLPVAQTTQWGLDHGAWSPLMHLMPEPEVPVLPISICPSLGPEAHERLGAAIAELSEGHRFVLMATGSLVHRLDLWNQQARGFPAKAEEYRQAALASFGAGRWRDLWNVPGELHKEAAPEGGDYPLRVLSGAFPQFRVEILAGELEFDAVSLDTVRFWAR